MKKEREKKMKTEKGENKLEKDRIY